MEADREVDEILLRCFERPEEEWDAAIQEACALREDLAASLHERSRILRSFGMTGQGLAGIPPRIGDYELLHPIGGGTMGTVFLARRVGESEHVAVKVLQSGLQFSEAARRRFSREREIVARLEHPGICAVRESGEANGVPFLAMEHIQGESLKARLLRMARAGVVPDEEETQALLEVIEGVARALQAAHAAGLVHRDVKPGNIVVRADGQPVLLDFGLARDVEAAATKLTLSGSLLGSPAYMSPEVIDGREADARSDVYSLGVTLHECLTLELPFEAPTREALFRHILRDPAPDPRRRNPSVGKDLASVLRVAMAKALDERYGSAEAFAEDLAAARRGAAVSVKPPGALAVASAWVGRNPLLAVFLFVLLLGLGSTVALLAEVSSALRRMRALGLAGVAAGVEPELAVLLGRRSVELLEDPVTVSQLQAALARYHKRIAYEPGDGPVMACAFRPGGSGLVSLTSTGQARICDASGGIEAEFADVRQILPGPGGDEAVLLREDGLFRWRSGTGSLEPVFAGTVLAMSIAGGEILTLSIGAGGSVFLHRSGGDDPLRLDTARGAWTGAEIAASGRRIFLQGSDRVVCFDSGGQKLGLVPGDRLLEVSKNGESWIVSDGARKAWYRHSGDSPFEDLTPFVEFGSDAGAFRFSPSSERLAVLEGGMTLRVLDRTGASLGRIPAHGVYVAAFDFSPDERYIVTADGDALARLYTVDGSFVGAFHGHRGHVTSLAFSPHGELLATGSYDRQLRLFRVRPSVGHLLDGSRTHVVCVDVAPGDRLLWVDDGGDVWLRQEGESSRIAAGQHRASFVGGGAAIIACDKTGVCRLFDTTGTERALLARPAGEEPLEGFATSPGGRWIAAANRTGELCVWTWDGKTCREAARLETGAPLLSADIVADGSQIACAGIDGVVRVYDLEGKELTSFQAHSDWIWSIRISPAGDALLTTSRDNTAKLWSLDGTKLAEYRGHQATIARGVFSPDGKLIATVSTDRTVRLWNLSGSLRAILRGHRGQVWDVAFNPDGQSVISAAYDRQVRIWPVETRSLLDLSRRLVDRGFTSAEREIYREYLVLR